MKYNGKELETSFDLQTYEYGARQYNSQIGRWNGIDPLADKYYGISPFAYVANNPIRFIDPDGMRIRAAGITGTPYETTFNKVLSLNSMKGYYQPFIDSRRTHYTLTYNPYNPEPRSAAQTYPKERGSGLTNYNSLTVEEVQKI